MSAPLGNFAAELLGRASQGATVEVASNVSPPLTFTAEELLAAPAPGEQPPLVLSLVRPVVTVRDARGSVLVRLAPGGEPQEDGWLIVAAVVVVLAVSLAALLVSR